MTLQDELKQTLGTAYPTAPDNFNVLTFNLQQDAGQLSFGGEQDADDAVAELKTYQRLLRLEPDVETAKLLMNEKLDSSQKITQLSQSHFVEEIGPELGENGSARARDIYLNAAHIKSQTMHMLANVYSVDRPHARSMAVNHISDEIPAYFRSLPSYEQLFGTLDYCDCEECRSIFSPAAYLVDLLRIIDKTVTNPNRSAKKPEANRIPTGMALNERRPDLAQIPLTCAATNDTVPYLQIVNQILAQTVTEALGQEAYRALATQSYPFNLPFNLPLQQIRAYLGASKATLADVYQTLTPEPPFSPAISREILNLSGETASLLTARARGTELAANYGLINGEDIVTELKPLQRFMQQTNLSREQIHVLLGQQSDTTDLLDVSGKYELSDDSWGDTLTLNQVGNIVTGVYEGGRVHGTLDVNVLKGQWQKDGADSQPPNNENAGKIEFTFDFANTGFDGQRRQGYGANEDDTALKGTRDAGTLARQHILHFITQDLTPTQFPKISIVDGQESLTFPDPKRNDGELKSDRIESVFDRINRFVRLADTLGWSYGDLDWTLHSLGKTKIDDDGIVSLAKIKKLQDSLNLSLDLLSTLWFDLQTNSNDDDDLSTFDQLFNEPATLKQSTNPVIYHPKTSANKLYQDQPLRWIVNREKFEAEKSEAEESEAEKLTTGEYAPEKLQQANTVVSSIPGPVTDMMTIANQMFASDSSVKKNGTVELDLSHLSVLYRHSLLAKQLRLRVPDYLLLLDLLELGTAKTFKLDDLLQIIETVDWLQQAGLNVYQVAYICNQTSSDYVNPGYDTQEQIQAFINTFQPVIQQALVQPTDFQNLGIDQETAHSFFDLLVKQARITASGVVLSAIYSFDPDFSTISQASETQREYVIDLVKKRGEEQEAKFTEHLAAFLKVKSDILQSIVSLVRKGREKELDPDHGSYLTLFVYEKGEERSASPSKNALRFINTVTQYLQLQKALGLNSQELLLITGFPKIIGLELDDFRKLTLKIENVRDIFRLKVLTANFGDDQNRLLYYLVQASTGVDTLFQHLGLDLRLYRIADWSQDACDFLCDHLFEGENQCNTITRVWQVNQAIALSQTLGVSVRFLADLSQLQEKTAADHWKLYTTNAETLLQALQSETVPEAWDGVYKGVSEPLEEQKRTALVDLAIRSLNQKFAELKAAHSDWRGKYPFIRNHRDLYEHLLIDVDMAGCAKISYVKEALNAAQLYLHRARLNLESNITIGSGDISEVWWEWLMNYRVWEANRKIFLYPENYLEPTLRKSKTSLFKELENTLMQGEVTQEKVQIAYRKYLDEFEDLAKLQYIDAYHCTVHKKANVAVDTLYLLARTQKEPYEFYYITREPGDIWSEWKKIDISINAQQITPLYIFNKLFLFWVELKEEKESENTSSGGAGNKKRVIYKATIKYTFYNFNHEWVQPQTLVADQVVNVESSQEAFGFFNKAIFDPQELHWHKVSAMKISSQDASSKEKAVIVYGPMITNDTSSGSLPEPQTISMEDAGKDVARFNKVVSAAQNKVYQLNHLKLNVSTPLLNVFVLNEHLELDTLTDEGEVLLLDQNQFSRHSYKLKIQYDDKPLLAAVPSNNIILDNFHKSYLIYSVNNDTFISDEKSISPSLSAQITSKLKNGMPKLVDDKGIVSNLITGIDKDTMRFHLGFEKVNDDQAAYVRHRLVSFYEGVPAEIDEIDQLILPQIVAQPIVPPTTVPEPVNHKIDEGSFVSSSHNIDANLSARINQKLRNRTPRLVNADGSVAEMVADLDAETLQFQLGADDVTLDQAGYVLQRLLTPTQGASVTESVNHKIDEGSFVSSSHNIDANLSARINQKLRNRTPRLVNADGSVAEMVADLDAETLQFQLGADDVTLDQAGYVLQRLLTPATSPTPSTNGVGVQDSSFVSDVYDIDINLSAQIKSRLQSTVPYLIDSNGTVKDLITGLDAPTFIAHLGGFVTEIQAVYVRSRLYDLYYGVPSALLSSLPDQPYQISSIRNQPDWCLFSDRNEMFLIMLEHPDFNPVDNLVITKVVGKKVAEDSFVSTEFDIDKSLSSAIFERLQANHPKLVNPNGTVDDDISEIDSLALVSLLNRKVTLLQATYIRKVLSSTRFAANTDNIVLKMSSSEPLIHANGTDKLKYKFIRVTNSAVQRLAKALFAGDLDDVLSLPSQNPPQASIYPFDRLHPTREVEVPQKLDGSQVSFDGPYGNYYWELFFHGPMLVSDMLAQHQQFQDAEKWLQYIFDPTADESDTAGLSPARYWQFLPFKQHTLESLREQLNNSTEIKTYDTHPFDPHAIARLRIGAYEKAVVMKYIDNLLNWGDYEFTRFSWESITKATMLYTYAYDLLGARPQSSGVCDTGLPKSFQDIQEQYTGHGDGIPQFLIELEHHVDHHSGLAAPVRQGTKPFNELETYFCVPENDKFIAYWDRVEDRLYKIRHCLNIKGQKQPLPLFQPPIDPMQLVRAAAAGNSVLGILSQLQPRVPHYRFSYMLLRAKNIAGTLSQLGTALLSVLEKNDAEALVQLRSTHEVNILNLTTKLKEKQIEDLQVQLETLQSNLSGTQYRAAHYQALINSGLNGYESSQLDLLEAALIPQGIALGIHGLSIAGYVAPVIFGFSDGGMKLGDAITAGAQISDGVAGMLNQSASIAAIMGEHIRRSAEWQFQQELAQHEIDQIQHQIVANQIRIDMSQQELVLHQKQIEQVKTEEDFLKRKYTNQELYQWMLSRISTIYFQTYKLALDMALAAQAAYQFEIDRDDQYITFEYWDSLHKGLLSGESLILSLDQMEKAYIENNPRKLEIEKTISLRQEFPQEFIQFKMGQANGNKGEFNFTLSQKLFDFDFPGHYCRKIQSISVSIPAIVGPYQNVHATLTQRSSSLLLKADKDAANYLIYTTSPTHSGETPDRPDTAILRENWMPNQQIAISSGLDDSGMFVLDFKDERYLPFEGTGAVSSWTLSMPPETNRIHYGSISDIIVKVKYTAYDGGLKFREDVQSLYEETDSQYNSLQATTFNLKQAFTREWHALFASAKEAEQQSLSFVVTDDIILPNLKVEKLYTVLLQLELPDGGKKIEVNEADTFLSVKIGDQAPKPISFADNFGELNPDTLIDVGRDFTNVTWSLIFDHNKLPESLRDVETQSLDSNKLLDMVLVIVYQSTPF